MHRVARWREATIPQFPTRPKVDRLLASCDRDSPPGARDSSWVIGRPFSGSVRDGVLALGVSSTEVAAVGLVALAGGSAVLALGALAGSLVVSALIGPVLLGALAGAASDVAVGNLVGRFALVVLLPLACGLLVIELRDFAVAAALAAQAFGPAAATVAGVYGVLMLLLGAAGAHALPRLGARSTGSPDAPAAAPVQRAASAQE